MKLPNRENRIGIAVTICVFVLVSGVAFFSGCGGSSSSGSGSSSSSSGTTPVANTTALDVNFGPANNDTNVPLISLTVCEPNTSTCQTLSDVEVDTGSTGLRVVSSVLTVSLPQTTDSSGNVLQNCVNYADGSYAWGPVATADIQIAGEKASAVPVQIISATPSFAVPSSCVGTGANDNTVATLGANAILGLGNFQQDCGSACTPASTSVPPIYYLCPSSVCQVASLPLASQLQNPVYLFPQDNNGILVSLPSIPATGQATATGSLIFGIGTQTNNALGSAKVYTTDDSGNFQTTYNGVSYSQSFLDTGSNGIFFLSASALGIPDCAAPNTGWYCPSSTVNYTATNTGLNGTSGQVTFSVANADSLFATPNAAFNDLGGDGQAGMFDWGLPFFYGRNVFVGIEGQTSPGGTGPYWAY
jgi:hypothetical protein